LSARGRRFLSKFSLALVDSNQFGYVITSYSLSSARHRASLSRPPPLYPIPILVKKKGVSLPSNLGHDWYPTGMNELPPHRSFSQLSTWQSCPQKYYLSKVAMVPEKPAVYLAAGSAVHSMLEWLNHELYRQSRPDTTN
jgi:hypothetical protein